MNGADIIHLDWKAVENWSRWKVIGDLEKTFGTMDGDIEEASIEHAFTFEGAVSPCEYVEIKDGKRMSVSHSSFVEIETADCNELEFVITDELKLYASREEIVTFIENAGGSVAETVTTNTDYLICNDIESNSFEMQKTKELGISVLSEAAFIRKYAGPEDFDDLLDEEFLVLDEDYWNLIGHEGLLDFVVDNGT